MDSRKNKQEKNKMLNQLKKIGNGLAALVSNKAGSVYRTNLMVADIKAKYVKGCDSVVNLNNQKIEIQAQRKISLEELDKVEAQIKQVVKDLKSVDVNSISSHGNFNILKSRYEALVARKNSINETISKYNTIIDNLVKLITKTKSECERLKEKYTELEFNVQTYKNMKRINDVIAITTDELVDTNMDVEQLNDDLRIERAKFNVRAEESNEPEQTDSFMTNPDDMKKFIDSL